MLKDLLYTFGRKPLIKGGYLDFLHLTELRNISITEIYMKKKKKNNINH